MAISGEIQITTVTANNVSEAGVFCIKNKKAPGYHAKLEWFKSKINEGLKIQIATDDQGKQLGFIEYIPAELAWRPIRAKNYFFIQCITVLSKAQREKGLGSALIKYCEEDALKEGKSGICTMSSKGVWIANKTLFERNDFQVAEKQGRFELMVKQLDDKSDTPSFRDWTKEQSKYKGWHLIYADQCPWHEKSVTDLLNCAMDNDIELNVVKLETPEEAQHAPSGYGTFSLIKDGKLISDHYLSKTRFQSILKTEAKK